ncbi:TetR/AcrR family transcriptional regulator [Streptomyces sp. Isolate_45]|uniref:TetR/AcrR family transcriptional regulator n=1 Tax=unclassified Streptomyces TaxID=2593676 RepID=UPI0024820CC3|nr:TetR/AcrR family transcriptional regulator [Streptomyces sp. Isolate_45]MDA5282190.1 TetR/AcrR family transcriptional regulator [Streptomyces sp. Isolate_45]
MLSPDTYQRILTAALSCFLENGVQGTTVEQVRKRAEVSNGSLFHHFRTKQDLAEAVYLQGLEQHQAELLAVLTPQTGLRAGVEGVVHRHLTWVEENPQLAAFLSTPPAWFTPLDAPRIAESSRGFFRAVTEWLRRHGWDEALSLGVVIAVWIGPAHEYTRRWLLTGTEPPGGAAGPLSLAAWNALHPLLSTQDSEHTR